MSLLDFIPESVKRRTVFVIIALGALGWFAAAWYGRCTQAAAPSCCSSGMCAEQGHHSTVGCDNAIWAHIYHAYRLQVDNPCTVATGIIVDATHGKKKNGCRSEADGDLHCWIKLDAGQERFLNQKNIDNEGGNLVFEPICQHKVTQADAKAACKDYKQPLVIPPVGTHVRIVGAAVTDLQHGHKEFHPVWSITKD